MSTNLAAQTLVGLPPEAVYRTVETTLPDGSKLPQLFQLVRYPDGTEKWELTSERIRAFDETFKSTAFKPAHWTDPKTGAVARTPEAPRETEQTVKEGGVTRCDLRRILVLNLGSELDIIRNKGLDTARIAFFEKNKAFFSTLVMMAYEHGGTWREASKFLKPAFQDTYNA